MRPAEPMRDRAAAARAAERREIEGCLARWGLLGRPRSLAGSPGAPQELPRPAAAAPFGRRLRGALEELGPVFSAFGLYLSSRVDLLAAADCLELSAISGQVPPLPVAAVRERITAEIGELGELGQPADAVLAELEPEPCESRLLVQGHRARLADGKAVVLRFVRPDAAEAAEPDLARLPLLAGAFAGDVHAGGAGWPEGLLAEVVANFRQSLRAGADLAATADALGRIALDAEDFGLLAAPVVRRDLCTPRLLVVGDPGGTDLAAALAATSAAGAAGDAARSRELVRLLCVAWLRQAMEGRVFPVGLAETGARAVAGGRLALLGGSFARPPAADRTNLRGFLVAMAAQEPDDACSYLLREMTREGSDASEETLRLQIRQVVPFRDGAWSAAGTSLAEHVFVCARQARACGFRPRPQLVAFYRGLAAVAIAVRQARQPAPEGPERPEHAEPPELPEPPENDALLEALREVRVLTSFSQVREAMSPPWSDQWGRYAVLMSELPRKVDELLALAAERGVPTASPEVAGPARREEGSHLLLAGALMVLGALALLLHYFVQSGALAGRGESVGATLFLAVGGVLLWILARSR
jgi:predicted unusual protein kinase regulating ubiquinone biosynthesis (AarF/ABC1/UbiB family)